MTHWPDVDNPGNGRAMCGMKVKLDDCVNEYTTAKCPDCRAVERKR